MKMALVGAFAAVVWFAVQGNAQDPVTPDSKFVSALRAAGDAATARGEFSGAVLVIRDGRTVFEGVWGFAERERGIANTPLTQFRVGSMNKMLTAVATLQLVQAGRLRLDAPFGTYLTDYPNAEMASKVTLHHLLTHTGATGDIFGPQFTEHRLELGNTADYLRLYGTRAPSQGRSMFTATTASCSWAPSSSG